LNNKLTISDAFDKYATTIQIMCYMYLSDHHLAEDAVSETFLHAYTHLDSFKGKSSLKTWLVRIAINVCKDMIKKERLTAIPTENIALLKDEQPDYTNHSLGEAIKLLPTDLREIVILYYYMEYKTYEIAKLLDIPRTTVNYRLLAAKKELKVLLKEAQS